MNFRVREIGGKRKRPHLSAENVVKKIRKNYTRYRKPVQVTGMLVATLFLMVLVYLGEQTGVWFKASVLDPPQPFNGTALPVARVPKWSHWNTQSQLRFEEISPNDLIDLPKYDLERMAFPNENLQWGNAEQDPIRNVKITYPVVYMGNYKLDYRELAGSHLGIDIKLPVGTPVHTIANGKVVKTSTQDSGFGKHVVVMHPNVPDPENPGARTTLYSAYNHMDRVDVAEGQNVLKGQIVGLSGNTGTSTTPHLHFQIDKESAPWHPYWPFSWAESQAAGLSFFEAVNAGLGFGKGRENTVNPMEFVYRNIGAYSVASSSQTSAPENPTTNLSDSENSPDSSGNQEPSVNETEPASDGQPEAEAQPETITEVVDLSGSSRTSLFDFRITGEATSIVGNGVTLIVHDDSDQIQTMTGNEVIKVELTGVGRLITRALKPADFRNGEANVVLNSDVEGVATVAVGRSDFQVSYVSGVSPVSHFWVRHDGKYQRGIVETVEVVAMDQDGNIAPAVNFSGLVTITPDPATVKVVPETLRVSDFKAGIARVKVTINQSASVRIRAQNGALVGVSDALTEESRQLFGDVPRTHASYEAIKALYDRDVINGYPDGTFKPEKTVNRVEALKMLMTAFRVESEGPNPVDFRDVETEAWYAGTLSAAVSKGIVKGYADGSFRPGQTVNRAEYLKILFNTAGISAENPSTKPYLDVEVSEWYAPYAYLANRMNLLEAKYKLHPSGGMTRADVAETIYRLLEVKEKGLVSYSK